jgi:hypothetical protein
MQAVAPQPREEAVAWAATAIAYRSRTQAHTTTVEAHRWSVQTVVAVDVEEGARAELGRSRMPPAGPLSLHAETHLCM